MPGAQPARAVSARHRSGCLDDVAGRLTDTTAHPSVVHRLPGWTVSRKSGDRNDAEILDVSGNEFTLFIFASSGDPAARCQAELKALKVWVPGTVEISPPTTLGGRPAPGGTLTGADDADELRCATSSSEIYHLTYTSRLAGRERTAAAFRQVAASWRWE